MVNNSVNITINFNVHLIARIEFVVIGCCKFFRKKIVTIL